MHRICGQAWKDDAKGCDARAESARFEDDLACLFDDIDTESSSDGADIIDLFNDSFEDEEDDKEPRPGKSKAKAKAKSKAKAKAKAETDAADPFMSEHDEEAESKGKESGES